MTRRTPWPACAGQGPASGLELVRRRYGLRDDHLRRSRPAHRADERLEFGVAEELLELLERLPLVHDDDVAVTDAEAMVQRACRPGLRGDLLVLARPVRQRCAERGGICLELPDNEHGHGRPPSDSRVRPGYASPHLIRRWGGAGSPV